MTDEDFEKLSDDGRQEHWRLCRDLSHAQSDLRDAVEDIKCLNDEIDRLKRDREYPPVYRTEVRWAFPVCIVLAWFATSSNSTVIKRLGDAFLLGSASTAWLLWIAVVGEDLYRFFKKIFHRLQK